MVKRRIEWFEAKVTLECVICDKDIEVGDYYCLNDTVTQCMTTAMEKEQEMIEEVFDYEIYIHGCFIGCSRFVNGSFLCDSIDKTSRSR
jgi:hypothetical protein